MEQSESYAVRISSNQFISRSFTSTRIFLVLVDIKMQNPRMKRPKQYADLEELRRQSFKEKPYLN